MRRNICVVRAAPSCRFTENVIQPHHTSSSRIYLLSHKEHMGIAGPDHNASVEELMRSPQSIAHPAGWKSWLEHVPREVTIPTKCLSRCPHCQTLGARIHLGIVGAMVRRTSLLADPQMREFGIERPRSEVTSNAEGTMPYHAWVEECETPPMDFHPVMSAVESFRLTHLISSIHGRG